MLDTMELRKETSYGLVTGTMTMNIDPG